MNYFENAKKHFKTITRHRHEVIKNCFRAGIGLQGLFHDLSKYSPAEFIPGMLFFRETEAPMSQNVKHTDIPKHGCIIRDAISIIMNTGMITTQRPNALRVLRCRTNILLRWYATE